MPDEKPNRYKHGLGDPKREADYPDDKDRKTPAKAKTGGDQRAAA